MTSTDFSGLCFPVARVRYAGPTDTRGGRWIATIRRDNEHSWRMTLPYDHSLPSGSAQAVLAAREVHRRMRAALLSEDGVWDTNEPEPIAIPGDLSADEYVFTFVPANLLEAK